MSRTIETASVNTQRGEEIPPMRFLDSGPPRSAQHIIFYLWDALSDENRSALEEAPATARLALAEPWLDAGNGECRLMDEGIASKLAFAIRVSSEKHRVLAWCVMPSHVHVLMIERANTDVIDIVRTWMASAETFESRTAPSIWDTRFFADAGRGNAWMAATVRHIEGNPVAAGLASSPGSWRWSSASRDLGPLRHERRTPRSPARPLAASEPPAPPVPEPPSPMADPTRRATHVVFWLNDAVSGSVRRSLKRLPPARRAYVLDKALDKGGGRRSLANRKAAAQVRAEILAGDGACYGLIAWCVMPTHVHVLLSAVPELALGEIVARWMARTVRAANTHRLFRIDASPWAADFTRTDLVGSEDVEDVKSYIEYNPVISRLARTPQAWSWSSASEPPKKVGRP